MPPKSNPDTKNAWDTDSTRSRTPVQAYPHSKTSEMRLKYCEAGSRRYEQQHRTWQTASIRSSIELRRKYFIQVQELSRIIHRFVRKSEIREYLVALLFRVDLNEECFSVFFSIFLQEKNVKYRNFGKTPKTP